MSVIKKKIVKNNPFYAYLYRLIIRVLQFLL